MNEIIRGQEAAMCGVASLCYVNFILNGWYPDQQLLALAIKFNPEWGTTGEQMVMGAALLGLKAEWRNDKDLDELNFLRLFNHGIILNWMAGRDNANDGHYSVLHKATKRHVVLQDPDWIGSMRIVDRKLFESVWYDIDQNDVRLNKRALVVKK